MTKLSEQVLIELDYAIGELQRTVLMLDIILSEEQKQTDTFKRIYKCLLYRIDSGKAMMITAGYTPISYKKD